jgi:hypothetical protein
VKFVQSFVLFVGLAALAGAQTETAKLWQPAEDEVFLQEINGKVANRPSARSVSTAKRCMPLSGKPTGAARPIV